MSYNALTGKDLIRTVLLIVFLVALAYFFPYLPLFLIMVLIAGLIAISLHDGAPSVGKGRYTAKVGCGDNAHCRCLGV